MTEYCKMQTEYSMKTLLCRVNDGLFNVAIRLIFLWILFWAEKSRSINRMDSTEEESFFETLMQSLLFRVNSIPDNFRTRQSSELGQRCPDTQNFRRDFIKLPYSSPSSWQSKHSTGAKRQTTTLIISCTMDNKKIQSSGRDAIHRRWPS